MITILGYHAIEPPGASLPASPFNLSYETFEAHLRLLAESGAETVSLDHLGDPRREPPPAGRPRVAITFDDGHSSNYHHALELLVRHELPGCFFVTTAHIDSGPEWLTSDQIREMASAGMEFGSHTHTHSYLDDLSDDGIVEELARSKGILEKILGRGIDSLACPGGRYDGRLASLARSQGYRSVCTSVPGHNRRPAGRSLPLLDRYIIKNVLAPEAFDRIVHRRDRVALARTAYRGKRMLRRLLGNRTYQTVWNRLRLR